MSTLSLGSPLGQRVLAAQGKIESGQIANMRLYRLRTETVHTRIVGEARTLCGRSLRHHGEWAWQFIHNGAVGVSLPAHALGRNACKVCSRSPVITATAAVITARDGFIRT